MKATRSPRGEIRSSLIQVGGSGSYRTRPIGYSSRYRSPTTWMTASSFPSGDQSASSTPSRTSRGVPPAMGARASVPSNTLKLLDRGRRSSASSSREEIARIKASFSPRERDPRVAARVENTSSGLVPHRAL